VSSTFDRDSKEFLSVSHDLGTHEHDQEEVAGRRRGRLLTGNDEEKGADEERDSLHRIASETGAS
jgi:hypothetical protein